MRSRYVLIDESRHDLHEHVASVEQKQSAAVQQVPDSRSDRRSVCQPVSLGVSDHIDMYHTPVGMGEFPCPVLHSTTRKVSEGPPISVSTHFTPISSMLDLGSGLGTHMHSGTPAAVVDVGVGAFGFVSNRVYPPFLPTGAAPAMGVASSVSIATVSVGVRSLIHIAWFCRLYNQVGLWRHPVRLIRHALIPLIGHHVSIIPEIRLFVLRNHQWKCHLLMQNLITGPPLFKILRIWLLKWTGKV